MALKWLDALLGRETPSHPRFYAVMSFDATDRNSYNMSIIDRKRNCTVAFAYADTEAGAQSWIDANLEKFRQIVEQQGDVAWTRKIE